MSDFDYWADRITDAILDARRERARLLREAARDRGVTKAEREAERAENLKAHVQRIVNSAPPLTEWQAARIRSIMTGQGEYVPLPRVPIDGIVFIEPDLAIPDSVDIRTDDPELDFLIEIKALYDPDVRRYVAASTTMTRRAPGKEINGTTLRTLTYQKYMREGLVEDLVTLENGDPVPTLSPEKSASFRGHAPTDEALLWVARAYRTAEVLNRRPVVEVAQKLGLGLKTATNWIGDARHRGFIQRGFPY